VDVHLRVEKVGRRSLHYSFSVTSAREIAAEGRYIVVCRPADTMVTTPWPDHVRTQLSGGRATEMASAE
jgi:acyl-CoA thioesterase FadM